MVDYKRYIRNWPGNPRSDLTHLLAQPGVFPRLVEELAVPFLDRAITHIATVEAGGFALAGGVAQRLRAGVVLIRKAGRLDWAVETVRCVDFSGTEKRLELTQDAVAAGDRVLVVDDWSETGGQLKAAISLIERLGATVVGAACLHIAPAVQDDPQLARYHLHGLIAY